MANSLISMVKGDSTLINDTEVLNGQILFDETKQKIFLDDNTERKEYGGSDDNAVKKDDVAYVESAMVATRGYSAGNYIIVQDTLYKARTQINSGTPLVVGTNVSTTTVGNELTQINNDLALKANKSLLTANSKTAQLTYSSGKYGFTINGTFYEIGGGSMRVVKTGHGITNGTNPVTITLDETIDVNKYYVNLSGTQCGNKSGNVSGTITGSFVGGAYITNKTSTSFDIVAFSDKTNYSYQVIAFN